MKLAVVISIFGLLLHHVGAHKKSAVLSLRGGDLGPIKDATLSKTFSLLAACDGLGGILAPEWSMKRIGVDIEPGSRSEHYVHGIGVSASSMALSSYLAGTTLDVKKAIGYGLAVRLASVTFMILSQKYKDMGMKLEFFAPMWLALAVTVYALFTDRWEPLALAKAVSFLLGFHGIFLFVSPGRFLSKQSKTGKNDDTAAQATRDLASLDGGYMMLSGLVTGLLASGVDATEVAGYASLLYIPVIAKFVDVIKVDAILGIPLGGIVMLVFSILAVICAGTLGGFYEEAKVVTE